MFCAVANVDQEPAECAAIPEPPPSSGVRWGSSDGTEHAILEEVDELSRWCRAVIEEDGSRYAELAHRLQSLRELMLDRFDAAERSGDVAKLTTIEPRLIPDIARLRDQHRDLLECLDRLIQDLLQGESSFRGWAEVCDRFDSFASDCRQHERAETDFAQAVVGQDLGTAD